MREISAALAAQALREGTSVGRAAGTTIEPGDHLVGSRTMADALILTDDQVRAAPGRRARNPIAQPKGPGSRARPPPQIAEFKEAFALFDKDGARLAARPPARRSRLAPRGRPAPRLDRALIPAPGPLRPAPRRRCARAPAPRPPPPPPVLPLYFAATARRAPRAAPPLTPRRPPPPPRAGHHHDARAGHGDALARAEPDRGGAAGHGRRGRRRRQREN